jgi:hypothetical protein
MSSRNLAGKWCILSSRAFFNCGRLINSKRPANAGVISMQPSVWSRKFSLPRLPQVTRWQKVFELMYEPFDLVQERNPYAKGASGCLKLRLKF